MLYAKSIPVGYVTSTVPSRLLHVGVVITLVNGASGFCGIGSIAIAVSNDSQPVEMSFTLIRWMLSGARLAKVAEA